MIELNIDQAQEQLSHLLDLVQSGEDVVIHRDGKPVARLALFSTPRQPPFGVMRGEFDLPQGWDNALLRVRPTSFGKGSGRPSRHQYTLVDAVIP